jgi:NADP-dependent 3-hydroxy acid dehydrogenase YdfG
MSGIEGKVIVITGASSGIGEATALLLAERGAKVVLGARGSDRLESLARRIAAAGGEAACAPTDVKRREDLSNLVGLAIERYGSSTFSLTMLASHQFLFSTSSVSRIGRR